MALLSNPAIELLEQLSSQTWTNTDELGIPTSAAELRELKAAGLVESRIWPPPPARRQMSFGAASKRGLDRIRYRDQLRRTLRGSDRLRRIRAGQRRRAG